MNRKIQNFGKDIFMNPVKIGIAGLGALGQTVAQALQRGISGYQLTAASEIAPPANLDVPLLHFDALARQCDLIVECLPPSAVPALAAAAFKYHKNIIVISSSAFLIYPEILEHHKVSKSRIIVPSGALCGIDGVRALAQSGIRSARIATTKKPAGFAGAPYIIENKINLESINGRERLFSGTALEAAKAFPANVNVAATLSLSGIGPERTKVEIWADPQALGNSHEITVEGEFSHIQARIENTPDPQNPKSSIMAAQSIIAALKNMSEALVVI